MAYTKEVISIKSLFQPENEIEIIKSRVILGRFNKILISLGKINQNKQHKLFISYVWAAKEYHPQYDFATYKRYECYVEKIAEQLHLLGFEVYLDKWKDRGNQDYQALLEAMEKADKFVVFLSPLYIHKFMRVKKRAGETEHVVRAEGLLTNHGLFLNHATQENLFPVHLEPTPPSTRFLPTINRGYLSQEEGGIEACDYFNGFLFDLCKGLLDTGRGYANWEEFIKIQKDFTGFLYTGLPAEDVKSQAKRLEQKEERKRKRYVSERKTLVHRAVSTSSSEEGKAVSTTEMTTTIATRQKDINEPNNSITDSHSCKQIDLSGSNIQSFVYNPKRIPIGKTSFSKIALSGNYLVDKTLFIKHFMESIEDVQLQLITRPRHFGKTFNMTMLYEFISKTIEDKPNPYEPIFRAFAIGKDNKFFETHFAKYNVIFFTLKDLDASKKNSAFYGLLTQMSQQYKKLKIAHRFIDEDEKEKFNLISSCKLNIANPLHKEYLKRSLYFLAESIQKSTNEPVIILIDEYDYPLQKSTYNTQARALILEFLSCALKSDCYDKSLLTGISRVTKEGLFSSLNHCKVYTVQEDYRYSYDFGMTKAEINTMISWAQKRIEHDTPTPMPEKILDILGENYGGYLIGDKENRSMVYNIWSIMNYFVYYRADNYWEETGTTEILDSAIQAYKKSNLIIYQQLHKEFVSLFRGGDVTVEVSIRLSFEDLLEKKSIFWALLVNTGFITVKSYHGSHGGDDYNSTLAIPNNNLKKFLDKKRIAWFDPREKELLHECLIALNSTDRAIILMGLQKVKNINALNQSLKDKIVDLLAHKLEQIREAAKIALEIHHQHLIEQVRNQYIEMLKVQQKDRMFFAWNALQEWLTCENIDLEKDTICIQNTLLDKLKNPNALFSIYITCLESKEWFGEGKRTFECLLEGYSSCTENESLQCSWKYLLQFAFEIKALQLDLLEKYKEWIIHEIIGEYTSRQILDFRGLLSDEDLFLYTSGIYNNLTLNKEVCFTLVKKLFEGLPAYSDTIFNDWINIIFSADKSEEFREKMLSLGAQLNNINVVKKASLIFIEHLCSGTTEDAFTELLRNQLLSIIRQYGLSLDLKNKLNELCDVYLKKISASQNGSEVKLILKILLTISPILKLFYLDNVERENIFINHLLDITRLDDPEILRISLDILQQIAFTEYQRQVIIHKLINSYQSHLDADNVDKAVESLRGLYLFLTESDETNAAIIELLFFALESIDATIRKTAFKLLNHHFSNNEGIKEKLVEHCREIFNDKEWLAELHQYEEIIEQAIQLGISKEDIIKRVLSLLNLNLPALSVEVVNKIQLNSVRILKQYEVDNPELNRFLEANYQSTVERRRLCSEICVERMEKAPRCMEDYALYLLAFIQDNNTEVSEYIKNFMLAFHENVKIPSTFLLKLVEAGQPLEIRKYGLALLEQLPKLRSNRKIHQLLRSIYRENNPNLNTLTIKAMDALSIDYKDLTRNITICELEQYLGKIKELDVLNQYKALIEYLEQQEKNINRHYENGQLTADFFKTIYQELSRKLPSSVEKTFLQYSEEICINLVVNFNQLLLYLVSLSKHYTNSTLSISADFDEKNPILDFLEQKTKILFQLNRKEDKNVKEKQNLQQNQLPAEVIQRFFLNELKKLTVLNEESPRIFMVYAHSIYEKRGKEDHAKSEIVKQIHGYLNPTIKVPCSGGNGHLKLNLFSDLATQGNGSDEHNEYREADVLYGQLFLLPKHKYSVDYVILCGSRALYEYSEMEQVQEYTNYLRKLLGPELSKENPDFNTLYTKAESALATLKVRCKVAKQRFHHLYTELAFLTLRREEKYKEILPANDLIIMIIDRSIEISSSSILDALGQNHIYIGTAVERETDPVKLYLAIFELLRRLFGRSELVACRRLIDEAHQEFITRANPAFWPQDDIRLLVEKYTAHEERKVLRQRERAKSSFLALSTSSEEDILEIPLKSAMQSSFETMRLSNPSTALQVVDLEISKDNERKKKSVSLIRENTIIHGAADSLSLVDNPNARQKSSDEHQEASAKIAEQVIVMNTKVNQPITVNQKSQGFMLNFSGQAAMPISFASTLLITKELKNLIQDSLSTEKQYCFLLKRTNAYTLILTFKSSRQPTRVASRQLDELQKAMETCLKSASLEYECKSSEEMANEETLTIAGDKKVINVLIDVLVRQGLGIELAEINTRSTFFKAERNRDNNEEESTFTCGMQ